MEEVLQRIARMKDGNLDLSSMGLTELPHLPDGLKVLYCYGNQLTELPHLPDELETLWCYNNQLTELPHLPDGLYRFYCSNNPITYPPADVLSGGIKNIKEWMCVHPLTLTKSTLKQ